MLIYPKIDPIALEIGPLAIRWYGLMYLAAFLQFWWLGRRRILTHPRWRKAGWTVPELDDLLFYGVIGVIAGGRMGHENVGDAGFDAGGCNGRPDLTGYIDQAVLGWSTDHKFFCHLNLFHSVSISCYSLAFPL